MIVIERYLLLKLLQKGDKKVAQPQTRTAKELIFFQ